MVSRPDSPAKIVVLQDRLEHEEDLAAATGAQLEALGAVDLDDDALDIGVQDFVDDALIGGGGPLSGAQALDGIDTMRGEDIPDERTVLVNEEFRTVTAQLNEGDVARLEARPDVLAVVDDIDVFAYQEDWPGEAESEEFLEIDDSDIEELRLETELLGDFDGDPDDDEALTRADRRLLSQLEPHLDEDFEFEQRLLAEDGFAEGLVDGMPDAREDTVELVRRLARSLVEQASDGEGLGDSEVDALLRSAGLLGDDGPVAAAHRDYIPLGLRLIYAPQAWRYTRGRNARIAVIDTGIASRHPDLRVWGGASFVPGRRSWADDNGHGTHVAGTIAALMNRRGVVGVAPSARLYAVKVLNGRGSGKLSWILNGLAWCYRARMHVANLSLGSRVRTHDPRVYNRAYERYGRILRRRGILSVAASGNSNGPIGNPARCPSFLAVGAVDMRRRRASFSCYGPQQELVAPGVGVLSTYPPTGYRRLSGTSMAAPHVAGTAGLVKSRRPGWHGDRIRIHLRRTALDLGRAGRDWAFGYGLVNAYRAVR